MGRAVLVIAALIPVVGSPARLLAVPAPANQTYFFSVLVVVPGA